MNRPSENLYPFLGCWIVLILIAIALELANVRGHKIFIRTNGGHRSQAPIARRRRFANAPNILAFWKRRIRNFCS